ncbi:hypothetical protein GCM10010236_48690 [Streptomyces eurythermus]|nr:hypothetical protein GCM10010236_48690 [Streptomyces eurythermus]
MVAVRSVMRETVPPPGRAGLAPIRPEAPETALILSGAWGDRVDPPGRAGACARPSAPPPARPPVRAGDRTDPFGRAATAPIRLGRGRTGNRTDPAEARATVPARSASARDTVPVRSASARDTVPVRSGRRGRSAVTSAGEL